MEGFLSENDLIVEGRVAQGLLPRQTSLEESNIGFTVLYIIVDIDQGCIVAAENIYQLGQII